MRNYIAVILVAIVGLSMSTVGSPEPAPKDLAEMESGSGRFIIEGGEGRQARTITVHFHKPGSLTPHSPVLMVIPGAGRNGDDYRDAWIQASKEHGVLILSPSYPEKHYPEYWSYNLANMTKSVTLELRLTVDTNPEEWELEQVAKSSRDNKDLRQMAHSNPLMYQLALFEFAGMITDIDGEAKGVTVNRDREAWIYGDFDRIFDKAGAVLGLESAGYDMFGHSAGGQILHRTALFHPDSKANRILASNAGWYTVPDRETAFPYGVRGTGVSNNDLEAAFGTDLIVFLGEKDDADETRGSVRHTPEADAQGMHRLARGRHFFRESRAIAEELSTEFNWKLEVVSGIGHDYRRMSTAAADYLYGGSAD